MNPASSSADSGKPTPPAAVPYARGVFDEQDLALGWECANPALQIELWRAEAQTQASAKFN